MENTQAELGAIMTLGEISSLRVFGNPNDEARGMFDSFGGAKIVPQLAGVA